MKQPELGKKIAEMRKAKGLTQEELVEQCKLSVRTLQRIESGEVTPRSYTLRIIFAALGYDSMASQESQNNPGRQKAIVSKWLGHFYAYTIDLFNLKTNTMKKISILSLASVSLAFILLTVYSDSDAQVSSAKKHITKSNKNFVTWFNSGQIDEIVALYDENACIEGRGCGKEFIKSYYNSQFGRYQFEEVVSTDLDIKGDVVIESGNWKMIAANGITLSGKYSSEWRRVGDRWLIFKEVPVDQ